MGCLKNPTTYQRIIPPCFDTGQMRVIRTWKIPKKWPVPHWQPAISLYRRFLRGNRMISEDVSKRPPPAC